MPNGDSIEAEMPPSARALYKLWERVRKTAGADVMDRTDWIVVTESTAGIDDLLRAPLHFRVATLDGIKIEFAGVGTRSHT